MSETTVWQGESAAPSTPGTALRGTLMPGIVLQDKYKLIEQIGRGGMGVVWKAQDKIADRLVALKFVPSELTKFEAEMKRMKESFRKVYALQHQSICPLYSLENNAIFGYYVVMKYLKGETLDAYVLRKDPLRKGLPLIQAVAILSRAASALDYAHANGVIHRDIKPGNIFIVKTDDKIRTQVIDFGLADEIRTSLMRTSQMEFEIAGTRPYMAPEQWRGQLQTAATDQYALAVVAYELLAGHVPFSGSDVSALRLTVMQDQPVLIPAISESANAALQKALAKEAADRFPSCREFITALGGQWTSVAKETSSDEKSSFSSVLPKISRWVRGTVIGLCVLLVIGAAIFAGLFWGGTGDEPKPLEVTQVDEPAPLNTSLPPLDLSPPPLPPDFVPQYKSIFEAAEKGTVSDVQYFLNQGLSINIKDNGGGTPVHFAAAHNPQIEVVKYIVSQGADINVKNNWGSTPLHDAVKFNPNVEVLTYLVSRNADVWARDNGGSTPLTSADTKEKRDILLAGIAGMPPPKDMFEAAVRGTVNEMRSLLNEENVGRRDERGWTLLHLAAWHNPNADVVEYLVSQGIEVDVKGAEHATPLYFAAEHNPNVEITKFLVSKGADVSMRSWHGKTPLLAAAERNLNGEVVRYLVSSGADVNAKDNGGGTPLHFAAAKNFDVEVIKSLVSNGADVNAKGNSDETPLCSAVWHNSNVEVIEYLISQGADLHAKKGDGMTPLHLAVWNNSNIEVVKLLVVSGADVQAKNYENATPLHFSVRSNRINLRLELAQYLVSQGAEVNAKTTRGSTPLITAINWNNDVEILKYLVSAGADVNVRGNAGLTPLHYAAKSNGNVEVLKYLISEGADINAENDEGQTPLDIARTEEQKAILRAAAAEE